MAKVVFFNNPATEFGGSSLPAFFDTTQTISLSVDSSTKATFTDHNEFTMVLGGSDFAGETSLSDGTITSMTFFNAEGQKLATVKSVSIDAETFHAELDESLLADVFADLVLNKKDKFTASDLGDTFFAGKKSDVLIGGDGRDFLGGVEGNDTMTGGKGEDTFFFRRGWGKDVITDFDAKGKFGANQDFIDIQELEEEMKIVKSGKNDTLLNFGDSDSLLLKGVKPGQIDNEDFAL